MQEKLLLSVKDLSVVLEGKTVLKEISFNICREEVLAVIGPNGSGKTVMLKTLLGLIKPTGGEIIWSPEVRIGYLPQRFNVDKYLPMTVGEFLDLKSEKSFTPSETLQMVELPQTILKEPLAHLSGGQTQKILLAWTILDKPNILLFDEPTENIDPVSEESIYQLLHSLEDKLGIAMIIVSHDLNLVYRYATNVLCLNQKMICFGEPEKTLTKETLGELYNSHAFFHHHHGDEHYDH